VHTAPILEEGRPDIPENEAMDKDIAKPIFVRSGHAQINTVEGTGTE